MEQIDKIYRNDDLTNKVLSKKKKYDKNKLLIVQYMIADLSLLLSDFIPRSVSEKISLEAEETFNYFLSNNIVNVFLLLTKRKSSWEGIFKVFPDYLSKKQNFLKLEMYLDKGVIIFDLKNFYLNNIKKYNI